MIEAAYKTEMVEKETIDAEKSHVYCDHCKKEIPMNSRFYHVRTGHNDWGMDSCDSIEYKQICSEQCLVYYVSGYVFDHDLSKHDSQYLDIEKSTLNESYINGYSKEF